MAIRILGIALVVLGVALLVLTLLLAFTWYAFVSAAGGVIAMAFGIVLLASHANPHRRDVLTRGRGVQ